MENKQTPVPGFNGIKVFTEYELHRGHVAIVIDYSRPGTHKTYNVVENTSCDSKYFESEDKAFNHGMEKMIEYCLKPTN